MNIQFFWNWVTVIWLWLQILMTSKFSVLVDTVSWNIRNREMICKCCVLCHRMPSQNTCSNVFTLFPHCPMITLDIFELFIHATGIWYCLWVICLSKALGPRSEPVLSLFYICISTLQFVKLLPKILLNWHFYDNIELMFKNKAVHLGILQQIVHSLFWVFSSEFLVLNHFWQIAFWWTLGWFFCYCCSDIILDFLYQDAQPADWFRPISVFCPALGAKWNNT